MVSDAAVQPCSSSPPLTEINNVLACLFCSQILLLSLRFSISKSQLLLLDGLT